MYKKVNLAGFVCPKGPYCLDSHDLPGQVQMQAANTNSFSYSAHIGSHPSHSPSQFAQHHSSYFGALPNPNPNPRLDLPVFELPPIDPSLLLLANFYQPPGPEAPANPNNFNFNPNSNFNASANLTSGNGRPNASAANYKTRPCRHFQLGRCNLGALCNFAHGEQELAYYCGLEGKKRANPFAAGGGSFPSTPLQSSLVKVELLAKSLQFFNSIQASFLVKLKNEGESLQVVS